MSQNTLVSCWQNPQPASTHRPVLLGTRHMVVAGHYAAAHVAFSILEAGGNAVDAGCGAGIALGVLQPDIVNVAGVAPIILRTARDGAVHAISGLGPWPRAASARYFRERHGGAIPDGILRTVVPAAPDAWIAALVRFGTWSFGDVAAGAIRFAREGFPIYPLLAESLRQHASDYGRYASNAAIFLPGNRPPGVGEIFMQLDLARTLQYMADEELSAARRAGRDAGLAAAHNAFYRGDIAAAIARFHRENGGLLTGDDLAAFRSEVETPPHTRSAGIDIYACGAWCQGPALLQVLNFMDPQELHALGHNSTDYIHFVVEALKLVFADRERYFGDPRFVDVPLAGLLSPDYAGLRRGLIEADRAAPGMPPPGDPRAMAATVSECRQPKTRAAEPNGPKDTSYICVVDRWGNVFSATPSDSSYDGVVVPGTGLCPSTRGSQSWTDEDHASCLAGGKRPRLTPNPALALGPDGLALAFGSPGGDVQIQAMLQVFLNIAVFGMDPQQAVEAPRFNTFSFPDSFEPHAYYPGRLALERRLGEPTGAAIAARGHRIEWWPDLPWQSGAVCAILARQGLLSAGADPRRPAYALGW